MIEMIKTAIAAEASVDELSDDQIVSCLNEMNDMIHAHGKGVTKRDLMLFIVSSAVADPKEPLDREHFCAFFAVAMARAWERIEKFGHERIDHPDATPAS